MPAPVMALVGEDSFLQTLALRQLLSSLPKDAQRIDFEGDRAELAAVLDEVRSFSMFGGSKAVIVREADDFVTKYREMLERYVAHPVADAVLVLRMKSFRADTRLYKAIDKIKGILKCQPPREVAQWIVTRAKQAHRLTVSPSAARLLADRIGEDFGRIDSELDKLALMIDGDKLDDKTILAGVAFQREQEMWDLTNALAAGRTPEALRRWRQLAQMDSSAEFRAVTWLCIWLENVCKALSMKNKGIPPDSIAQQLRIWPRERQQEFFRTAGSMGLSGAARALDLLVELDRHNKSGIGEPVTNIERFILRLGL